MRNSSKALVVLSLLLAITSPEALAAGPEDLLGISLDFEKSAVTIQVVSSGCTKKDDFAFEMKGDQLTILRKQRDECKRMPEKVSLTFTLKEAGIDPNKAFNLVNKLTVNENTANIR